MIRRLLKAGKPKLMAASIVLMILVACADWSFGQGVSLAALYILPMMLGALVLQTGQIVMLALICAYLRFCFDVPGSPAELVLRFVFAVTAYCVSALFVQELVRNQERAVQHLQTIRAEQAKRKEAEEQFRFLADSSPAAILTIDGDGAILAANGAATRLFAVADEATLQGQKIRAYLPVLADALNLDMGPLGLRTAAQCQGYRANGEIFLAHTWFSSYSAPGGVRLAAIAVDASEEMRDREEQGLRQLLSGNQIAAAAVAHEVRNFCGAMSHLCEKLVDRNGRAFDGDLRGLMNLVEGLNAIAELELNPRPQDVIESVHLKEVLNNLRIVIEPDWHEIDGVLTWELPREIPLVLAEPHGLLQAFLNLAKNSHRAVREAATQELQIEVSWQGRKVFVRFRDSGRGVADPDVLFQPFQRGAAGSGLGLYVSRSIVRSYGGDIRFESQTKGSCFAIELQTA